MSRLQKTILVSVATIGAVVLIWPHKPADTYLKLLKVNGIDLHVYVAKSPEEWQRGLSGLSGLAQDSGMLFIFNEPGVYYMWMKDMKFPIDIIWIDDNFRIIYIKENARPESYPERFGPKHQIRYVLEVNAGWIERNKIEIGQKIVYNDN